MVGISGNSRMRVGAATARPRHLPALTMPADVFADSTVKSQSPVATAVIIAPASLNGTCISTMPAAAAKDSTARWLGWPLPSDA